MNTSPAGLPAPTRTATLRLHLIRAIEARTTTKTTFGEALARAYVAMVPEHARGLDLHPPREASVVDWELDRDALRHQVDRLCTGQTRFPAELEEAWVAALPEPHRHACLAELASRHGLLAVPIPAGACGVADFAHYLHQFGQSVEALAPIVADGRIDQEDREHIPEAIAALREVITRALAIQCQMERATTATQLRAA